MGPDGQLYIRGRKKEMIVTPEGLNVFPEDVERVLNELPGVRESAVIGAPIEAGSSNERVHAVLVVDEGVDADAVVRQANATLDEHQKIRRAIVWPHAELPRTEGTRKLKRAAIRDWVRSGGAPPRVCGAGSDDARDARRPPCRRSDLSSSTTLEELGLSSLDRVELMVALEDAFQTRIDESAFSEAQRPGSAAGAGRSRVGQRRGAAEPVDFPTWTRSWWARATRRVNLPLWILRCARVRVATVSGRDHLADLEGPVIFASNHQSFMDGPVIMAALPARWRYAVAPAMLKEMFAAHFFPAQHTRGEWFQEQPELLPRGAVFQRVSAAAARSRCSSDAADISANCSAKGRR